MRRVRPVEGLTRGDAFGHYLSSGFGRGQKTILALLISLDRFQSGYMQP